MSHKDSSEHKQWFQKANHDLEAAQILFDNDGFMDTIGYHLHQTLEKYLKGYLIFLKQEYPFSHNLVELLKLCGKFDEDIKDYFEECERINAYYIEAKYPADMPVDYPRQEIQESISMTDNVVKYIIQKTN